MCAIALIVDPDVEQQTFLARVLEDEEFVVRACATGCEALTLASAIGPQLVTLEVETGEICGYEVCHSLRETFGNAIAVIFISGDCHDRHDRVAGLLLGADDFIAKPISRDELRARVHAVTRRARRPHGESVARADVGLTEREREVLQLLADGLDQNAIARRLCIAPKTVGKHIEHILEKLAAHSRAELVAIAYRHGLAQRREEDPESGRHPSSLSMPPRPRAGPHPRIPSFLEGE